MARQLSHEDGRAIDLLLNRNGEARPAAGAPRAKSDKSAVKKTNTQLRERLQAAENVLRLLNHLPAEEPPAELVRRTLLRIESTPALPSPSVAQRSAGGTHLRGNPGSHA